MINVGFLQGTKRLIEDIEKMTGPKPRWFWWIFIISWRFIAPILLLFVLIYSIVAQTGSFDASYIITIIPLSFIPICAAFQIWKYRNDWVD